MRQIRKHKDAECGRTIDHLEGICTGRGTPERQGCISMLSSRVCRTLHFVSSVVGVRSAGDAPAGLLMDHARTLSSSFMSAAERNAMRSLRNALRDRVCEARCVGDVGGGRSTHLEKRFLPRPQYFLRQARELITLRSCSFVGVVANVVVVVTAAFHVEVKKLAIVFLEIPEKLGVLLSEFRQLQHVCSSFVWSSLSEKARHSAE
jgi:hypothetical protein